MYTQFGELLYELRKEKGLTQTQLADMLDITNKAVSKWETGETFPETAQLVPLARIFGVTVDELLNGCRNDTSKAEPEQKSKPENVEKEKPLDPFFIASISVGVGLILLGTLLVAILSICDASVALAVSLLLAMVALGASLCAFAGMDREIKNYSVKDSVARKWRKTALAIAIGVCLCILSPISIISFSAQLETTHILAVAITLFFLVLFSGVILLIVFGMMHENYLKIHKIKATSEEEKTEKIDSAISGSIMLLATAIYLVLGLVYSLWHPGWVVFPIGGILCGIVGSILKAVRK